MYKESTYWVKYVLTKCLTERTKNLPDHQFAFKNYQLKTTSIFHDKITVDWSTGLQYQLLWMELNSSKIHHCLKFFYRSCIVAARQPSNIEDNNQSLSDRFDGSGQYDMGGQQR